MDSFLESLKKFDTKVEEDAIKGENTRKDSHVEKDEEFVKIFNKNFPNKKNNDLIVEKKNWDNG